MKGIFSLFFVAVATLFLYSSCKKTQHATKPTPANYRILSYSERVDSSYPIHIYTFSYDAMNRVSQIIHTSSDSADVKYGIGVGVRSVFRYSNDSIYKYNSELRTGKPIDVNLFIKNTSGQIITAYVPSDIDNLEPDSVKTAIQYEYYGKLLSKASDKLYRRSTSISSAKVYTSNNGDFLAYNFDGKLTAEFSKSYTNPVAVLWTYIVGTPVGHASSTYSDVLTGYKGVPVTLTVMDIAQHSDTLAYPGGIQGMESYGVFPDKDNRPGDYLQIASFTMYGANIYQQAHLTKSVKNVVETTNIVYDIDAESKIKTTTATITGVTGAVRSRTFRFQYETF